MSGINRIPRGYLDIVGTETGGKNPSTALETLSPIIDLTRYYEGQAMAQSFLTFPSGPINSAADHQIPENEIWFVYNVCVLMTATVIGDGMAIGLRFQRLPRGPQNAVAQIHEFGRRVGVAAGDGLMASHSFPTPIPLQGGTVIGFFATQVIGNARTVSSYVLYSKYTG